jgi:anti-sigma B factor antagonist
MSVFECKSSREQEHVRLSLFGELDIAAAPQVEEALAEFERERPERIVLDLRGLTFLDSTGLRALLGADARAREESRRVTLIQGPEAVQRVFSITGLDGRLEIVADEAELAPEAG